MPDGTIPTENGGILHANGDIAIEDDPSQDLATRISASAKVREIRISPDGAHVVYQNQHQYKLTASVETSLWVAQTDVPESTRLLTGGGFFNGGTVFHPDGKRIVFLSDRESPGKAGTMYMLEFATAGPDTEPEKIDTGGKTVQGFDLSPDGAWITFLSPADTSEAHAARVKDKDDGKVYGEKVGLSRIMLYNFATGETSALKGVRDDMQVESATWSPDSKEILYRMRENKGVEYSEMPIVVERIPISGENPVPIPVATYPRSPSGQSLWLASGHIADMQSYVPSNTLDARTLFVNPVGKPFSGNGEGATTRLYGVSEDAVRIVNMQPGDSNANGEAFIAVEVCNDIDTHMDVVVCSADGGVRTSVRMYETDDEAVWFSAWDSRRVVDASGEVSYIFAAILSSAIRHEPLNAYTIRVDSKGALKKRVKLSSHLRWLAEDAPRVKTEVVYWKAADGTQLSGLVRYPPGYESGKLPTVLFLHGGPYRRMIPDYMPYFCNWRELLAWSGFLVISPNYRGSQGRGHEFAYAATLGVGVLDWADCDSMVDEMIRRGVVDPERLGVGGWSHGGSIAAWGVTKTKTRYKAAIIGAGVTNWEGMVMESGSPELEVAIGGSAPWDHDAPEKSERKTSPVHSVADVSTAVLILHGDKDERVPVGQAIGFWRGLKRRAADRGKEAAELVIYPREPHGFVERKHAEDVQRRVVAYFKAWL
ncbi:Peptidase-S9 domain-containing protein [Mycena venus]|uniref:Dipeptidyl-peptidase V n=1 Tax=Mycena venus TaxID=2733690 RepID=A0A8H6YFQ7_9AGAR|nr:Peptidase-S9 domain-containing protein [Mycena venus]